MRHGRLSHSRSRARNKKTAFQLWTPCRMPDCSKISYGHLKPRNRDHLFHPVQIFLAHGFQSRVLRWAIAQASEDPKMLAGQRWCPCVPWACKYLSGLHCLLFRIIYMRGLLFFASAVIARSWQRSRTRPGWGGGSCRLGMYSALAWI